MRSVWDPRSARNMDLEAERGGGGRGRMWYSDHDDRREPGSPRGERRPTRDASPSGKWGHDLFETVASAPRPAKIEMVERPRSEKPERKRRRDDKDEDDKKKTGVQKRVKRRRTAVMTKKTRRRA